MMIHIWQQIIDGIFPPSQSLRTLRQYRDVPYSNYYEPHPVGDTIAVCRYQAPLIKASITAGKFEHNQSVLVSLGELLRLHLANHEALYPPASTLFVPIPLHPTRLRERGYNQVAVMLQAATSDSQYRTAHLLTRTSNTSPQSHRKRVDRLSHLDGVFAYASKPVDWQTVTTVVLIDDVITTGSTLAAASLVLAQHLPQHVTLQRLALAH